MISCEEQFFLRKPALVRARFNIGAKIGKIPQACKIRPHFIRRWSYTLLPTPAPCPYFRCRRSGRILAAFALPFIGEGFRMRPARSEKRERSLGKREKIAYHLYSGLRASLPCVETTKTEHFASCALAQISGKRTSAWPAVGTHAHRQNCAPNGCRADRQIGGISRGCAPHRNLAATVLRVPVRSAFCESTAGLRTVCDGIGVACGRAAIRSVGAFTGNSRPGQSREKAVRKSEQRRPAGERFAPKSAPNPRCRSESGADSARSCRTAGS